MICVACRSVTDNFGIDSGAAFFRMFKFFEDKDTASLGNEKKIYVKVERTACMFRVIISLAHCLHGTESCQAELGNGGFRAAADHDVRISALNRTEGFTERV